LRRPLPNAQKDERELTDKRHFGHARKTPSRRQIQPRDFDSGIKRTKAKVKAALPGDEGPDEWDLPPKPKGMRWATYERSVARYDAAEMMLGTQLVMAAARLMKRP
jgi:hypothetical protein